MGTNGASARVFKEKTKINMAATLLSRVAFHLPLSFLSRTNLHRKTLRNMFENTLLSSSPNVVKLRSQFAVFMAPTSEREDGRDRTRRKSQSGHGALFTVGGFALSSMSDEKAFEGCRDSCYKSKWHFMSRSSEYFLPPSSTTSKAPRVTKITRILAKIVEHYKAAEETTS